MSHGTSGRRATGDRAPPLLTDRYELTMVAAALADGTADRRCVFEVFARRLPDGRRYGVVAGTGPAAGGDRAGSGSAEPSSTRSPSVVDAGDAGLARRLPLLRRHRRLPRGRAVLPRLADPDRDRHVRRRRACWRRWRCRSSTTTARSPSAAARMVTAAAGRPLIEMGSRRTHEEAAVAAARAAYLAGFAATSNLEAGRRYGIPTAGTAAHAFILLHDDELAAFRSQVGALGTKTTLLVDTYDIRRGIEHGGRRPPGPSSARSGSTPATSACWPARPATSSTRSGATGTRIVLSGDLDEYAIAALRAEPVDSYGVGTSVVTGSGRADRGDGLQAGRGRRPAGGQAQRVARSRAAGASRRCAATSRPAPRSRRSCTRRRPRPSSARTTGCCRCRWCAAASRSPGCRPGAVAASACAPRWCPCRGRASSSPAASPRSRPSSSWRRSDDAAH